VSPRETAPIDTPLCLRYPCDQKINERSETAASIHSQSCAYIAVTSDSNHRRCHLYRLVYALWIKLMNLTNANFYFPTYYYQLI
jgi:hypothetical protein